MFILQLQEASPTTTQTTETSSPPSVLGHDELILYRPIPRRSILSSGYRRHTTASLRMPSRYATSYSRQENYTGFLTTRDLTGLSITTNTPSAMPPSSTGYLMIGVVFSCLLAVTAACIGGLVWARNRHISIRSLLLKRTAQRNPAEPKFASVHLHQGIAHHVTPTPSIKVTLPSPIVSMSTMPVMRSQIATRAGSSRHVHTPSPLHAEHTSDLVYAVGRVLDPPPDIEEVAVCLGGRLDPSSFLPKCSTPTPNSNMPACDNPLSESLPEEDEEDDFPSLSYGISSNDSNDSTLTTEQLSWIQEHCQASGSRATLHSVRRPVYMLTDTEGESTECEVVMGVIGKRVVARSIEVKIVEQRFSSSTKLQSPIPTSCPRLPEIAVLPPARSVRGSIAWRYSSSSPLPWGSSKSLDLDDFPEPPPLGRRSFLQSPVAF
jgi:hypothetical protein